MKIRTLALMLGALITASSASSARAQAWDAPAFMPPRPGDDIGIYLTDMADFGIHGIWRQTGNLNLGLRLGYVDRPGDGVILVGAETWDLITAAGTALPVDVAWTLGAGAAFNGRTTFEVPLGLNFGLPVDLDRLRLQLYAHPRLGLFVTSVADETDLDLDPLFDLGLEALLNRNLKLRIAATFGRSDAVGIGVAYRWTRGAVVR